MKIEDQKMVTIEYTLKTLEGEILDSSDAHGPLSYIHGMGFLIPGLEAELVGKEAGAAFEATVPAELAYGERDEELIIDVLKTNFGDTTDLEVGMPVEVSDPHGTQVMMVADITEDKVILDGNHPLAGMALHFTVKVIEVRDATPEELEEAEEQLSGCGCGCEDDCDCDDEECGCGCDCDDEKSKN